MSRHTASYSDAFDESNAQMSTLTQQLNGYRLTTAEITYRMPDYPAVLQTFVWQTYDLAPEFPEVRKFLLFWESNLDGALHSVRVAQVPLITEGEASFADFVWTLH